jgi:hypothetical protein
MGPPRTPQHRRIPLGRTHHARGSSPGPYQRGYASRLPTSTTSTTARSECGCHPVLVRPYQSHEPDPRRIRTLCPICHGDGAVAHPRVMILIRYGQVRGYEVKPCALRGGWEWLPGVVAPT